MIATQFLIYGIHPEEDPDRMLYIGRSTKGLLRPYSYFHEPERCHNYNLALWIYELRERRHLPQLFVSVLAYGKDQGEIIALERSFISERKPIFNGRNMAQQVFTFSCDFETYDLARDMLAASGITLNEFVGKMIKEAAAGRLVSFRTD